MILLFLPAHLGGPSKQHAADIADFGTTAEIRILWELYGDFESELASYPKMQNSFPKMDEEIRSMHKVLLQYYSVVKVVWLPTSIEVYNRDLHGLHLHLRTAGAQFGTERTMVSLQQHMAQEIHRLAKRFLQQEHA